MKEQHPEIHLALAFDENFITPVYVLLTSIFSNNRKNQIIIHSIATGVEDQEKKRITEYVELNKGQIFFYDISKSFNIEELNFPCLKSTSFTIAIFYRLFFPKLVAKNVKRLLYIDVDTIVLDSLENLYLTDISPYPVAAALDTGMVIGSFPILLEKIGVKKENQFNSGVLLIDIEKWEQEKILEKCLQFMSDNQNILMFPDQVALNYALKGNYYLLSNEYNFCHSNISIALSKREILENNKITILHYTSSKPWHFTNSARLRFFYYYYLKKSPYINKKKYNDFTWTKYSFRGYIYIRILEFYLDHPWIRDFRKKIKL